ncbi:MAG: hypothetical protein Q9160_002650 [Pyrenula sp. 1 TL-2023]
MDQNRFLSADSFPLQDNLSQRTAYSYSNSQGGDSDDERLVKPSPRQGLDAKNRKPSFISQKASTISQIVKAGAPSVFPSLQWVVHGVSIAFSVTILSLCLRQVYFADLTRPNINSILNAFQLVAKLHEILVTASLGAIAIDELRHQLSATNGLPLGHIAAPFQLASIEILFTRRFWAATVARENNKRNYVFGFSILALTIITALMNPASATLVVPQLGWWQVDQPFSDVNGFTYLNASHEDMWPSKMNDSIVPDTCRDFNPSLPMPLNCPFAEMRELGLWAEEYLSQFSYPNITATANANMLRYLAASSQIEDDAGYTASSTGMSHLTRDLGDMWLFASRHNVSFAEFGRPMIRISASDKKNPIMQPVLQTKCGTPQDMGDEEFLDVTFPATHSSVATEVPLRDAIIQRVNTTRFRESSPSFMFRNLTEEAGRPVLGALAAMTYESTDAIPDSHFTSPKAQGLMACTMAAHWVPAGMTSDPRTGNIAIMDESRPLDIVRSKHFNDTARPIDIDVSYAHAMNLWGFSPNVVEYELKYFAFNNANQTFLAYDGEWGKKWSYLVSALISMQLADALARFRGEMGIMVLCEGQGCYNKTRPVVQDIIYQNNPLTLNRIPESSKAHIDMVKSHPELYTPIEWTIYRNGYAWGFNSVSKWLAGTVFLIHAILVLGHFALGLKRRTTADSWRNLVDLIALSVQSPPSQRLQGANAGGITDSSMWAAEVKVVDDTAGGGPFVSVHERNVRERTGGQYAEI